MHNIYLEPLSKENMNDVVGMTWKPIWESLKF